MKRIYLSTLIGILCLFSHSAYSQVGYAGHVIFFGTDSVSSSIVCPGIPTGITTATFSSGYAVNETAEIDINWGDGTIENETVTFIQGSYYDPSMFGHTYSAVGVYEALLTFSDAHGNVDTDTVTFHVTDNCAQIYTTVDLDLDNDGQSDAWWLNQVSIDFTGSNGVTNTYPFTGYSPGIDITQSPYQVTINPAWLASHGYIMSSFEPSTLTSDVNGVNNYDYLHFMLTCDPNNSSTQTDVSTVIPGAWGFRAGMNTGYVIIQVCNNSCLSSPNVDVEFTFDPLLTVYSHNIPGGVITGNTIHGNLNIDGCGTYIVYFSVPGATPANTPLNFEVAVTTVGITDFELGNNSSTWISEVRNSWDPNDKSVSKPEIISPSVQDELTYLIRFQNMGNDEAYNIVIKDTIDENLDLETFSILEFSHIGSVSIDQATRIATFTFPNINLPTSSVDELGSHGSVSYKIKEEADLPIGTEIKNTAYIYFDFNPAIVTNTTYNINQTAGIEEQVADDLTAYPVPATDYLVVSSKQNQPIQSIKLMDVTGKVVLNITNVAATYTMDLQGIASGAYNLSIESQGVIVNKKIMVKK